MITIRKQTSSDRRPENALACALTISVQLVTVILMSTVVWRHVDKLGF